MARPSGAATAVLAIVTVLTAIVVALSLTPFSLDDVSVTRIVVATLACGALGSSTARSRTPGRRGRVARAVRGLAIVVLVVGYVASYLLPLSDALAGLRKLSPWYWAIGTQPVTDGISGAWMLLLLGATAALVAAGTVPVNHRDIRGA